MQPMPPMAGPPPGMPPGMPGGMPGGSPLSPLLQQMATRIQAKTAKPKRPRGSAAKPTPKRAATAPKPNPKPVRMAPKNTAPGPRSQGGLPPSPVSSPMRPGY